MIAIFLLAAALPTASAGDVKISNLRSGLACMQSSPGTGQSGWICQPTELILVTDQGSCVYDRKQEPCTWHGFEFDYSAPKPGVKLQCVANASRPMDSGTPEKVLDRNVSTHRFELELPEASGHFFNPQYYLYTLQTDDRPDPVEETACSYNGTVVFRVRFRFRFPRAPAAGTR
jgi:hypothetical protein